MVILVGYCENGGLIWDFKCFQFDFCLAHCSTQKITVAICLLHCHENVMAVYRCTPNSTSTFMSVETWSLREVCHSHETFVNGATHPVFMVLTQDKSHGPSYQAHCICTLYHVFNSVFRWPHTGHAKPLLIRSISSEHTDTTQFWVFHWYNHKVCKGRLGKVVCTTNICWILNKSTIFAWSSEGTTPQPCALFRCTYDTMDEVMND